MPSIPIVDAHLHLWDPRAIRYPWLDALPGLNRPCLLEDYRAASESTPVDAMVFIQCEAEPAAFEAEAAWVDGLTSEEPRLRGLVAWAALEKGAAVLPDLVRLKRYRALRGVRRIIQFEADPDFCLRPAFVEGVSVLKELDLSFDICIDYRHLSRIVKLAEHAADVPMVLDHIGKPDIKHGRTQPWAREIRELAQLAHIFCKISGVATEADHECWTDDELKRYIDVAIEAFGFERVMFGSDWPVSTQAIAYRGWVKLLDQVLKGVPPEDQEAFWRGNATRFYRLQA